jgi:hypothetical protein
MMALSKMGYPNIMGFDFDQIDEHNISNQMFPVNSVGKKKTLTAAKMAFEYGGTKPRVFSTEASIPLIKKKNPDIICLCVDSLEARKKILLELDAAQYAGSIIDARMSALAYRVVLIRWGQIQDVVSRLSTDEQAMQERCGMKSIIYNVLGVASEVCHLVHHLSVPTFRHAETGIQGIGWKFYEISRDYNAGVLMDTRPRAVEPMLVIEEEEMVPL